MLPNILIIGGNRCATTWVYECLAEHPSVYMSKVKQIHFFDLNYSKGIDYYKTFFNDAKKGKCKAIGEASPSYLADHRCAERIKENIPDVKIIAILRNPIERAFSQYNIFKDSYDKFSSSFEEALKVKPALIDDGVYHKHLRRYYQNFSKNQILVLLYDDLINDEKEFIKKIYRFINVEENYLPANLNKKINTKVFPNLRKILIAIRLEWAVKIAKNTFIDCYLRKIGQMIQSRRNPKIDKKTRQKLIEHFKIPNNELENLIHRNLETWNK